MVIGGSSAKRLRTDALMPEAALIRHDFRLTAHYTDGINQLVEDLAPQDQANSYFVKIRV